MDETIWATGFFDRLGGLLLKKRFKGVLVLAPCKSIHTFCMRVAIDVAFVSKHGRVLEVYREVAPRKILKNEQAVLVLERISSSRPWFEKGDLTGIRPIGLVKEGEAA